MSSENMLSYAEITAKTDQPSHERIVVTTSLTSMTTHFPSLPGKRLNYSLNTIQAILIFPKRNSHTRYKLHI